MHHSTKTSRLANLVLALGLTIVTQLHSLGPDQAARVAPRASPLVAPCTQPSATALALAIDAEAVASATQPAACDRCRAICARSCSSYACVACAKSIKCGQTVQACVSTKRKA